MKQATQEKNKTTNIDPVTLKIIYYFIEKLDGVLGKTHLQKMLFLTDLLATKKFKEPLSKVKFQKYRYGPYSEEINEYIKDLKNRDLIRVQEFPYNTDKTKTYTRFYSNKKGSVKTQLLKEIGAEKILLIDEIINSYGNVSLQEVLDVVYKLEMVKQTELCKPIEMAKIIETEKNNNTDIIDIF
ncbi:Panacea domain-containing protein [Patescibacteria group bacterium]